MFSMFDQEVQSVGGMHPPTSLLDYQRPTAAGQATHTDAHTQGGNVSRVTTGGRNFTIRDFMDRDGRNTKTARRAQYINVPFRDDDDVSVDSTAAAPRPVTTAPPTNADPLARLKAAMCNAPQIVA